MKHFLVTTCLLATSATALADKQSDLAFEIKEHNSYTQSLVFSELMTLEVGSKCWDVLFDKKNALQSRIASAAHELAKYGSAMTGGDDWRHLEDQGNGTKEKNRGLVADRVAQIKGKLHVTLRLEGSDCDGPQPLWSKYLGEAVRSLTAYPPKSGKAFVTINVLAKAKGVKAEVSADGSTFTFTGARDIEEVAWDREIQKAFKKVSSKN